MKNKLRIYVTSSKHSMKVMPEIFEALLKILEKNNCVNLNEYIKKIIKTKNLSPSATKTDNQIYIKSLRLIGKSNFVIADVTFTSITVGRQIEYALQNKIPVLCMLNTKKASYISPSMFDPNIDHQTFRSYSNVTLEIVLSEYIKNYKNKKIRLNLFITREINNFLNWISSKKSISKSEVIRQLIVNEVKKFPAYMKQHEKK